MVINPKGNKTGIAPVVYPHPLNNAKKSSPTPIEAKNVGNHPPVRTSWYPRAATQDTPDGPTHSNNPRSTPVYTQYDLAVNRRAAVESK